MQLHVILALYFITCENGFIFVTLYFLQSFHYTTSESYSLVYGFKCCIQVLGPLHSSCSAMFSFFSKLFALHDYLSKLLQTIIMALYNFLWVLFTTDLRWSVLGTQHHVEIVLFMYYFGLSKGFLRYYQDFSIVSAPG